MRCNENSASKPLLVSPKTEAHLGKEHPVVFVKRYRHDLDQNLSHYNEPGLYSLCVLTHPIGRKESFLYPIPVMNINVNIQYPGIEPGNHVKFR